MRESVVEKYLHQQVTAAGGTTRKHKGRKADPDRIVIWPGMDWFPEPKRGKVGKVGLVSLPLKLPASVHFVETKAPGKKPRPDQEREHARLRAMRCTVLVIDTKAKVDAYVAENR